MVHHVCVVYNTIQSIMKCTYIKYFNQHVIIVIQNNTVVIETRDWYLCNYSRKYRPIRIMITKHYLDISTYNNNNNLIIFAH